MGSRDSHDVSDDIVALYREHVPDYHADLLKACQNDDFQEVLFHCHKMKSVMKMMGFDQIAEALVAIEQQQPSRPQLTFQVDQIGKMIDHSLIELDG